jgi:hypothetical protein
MADGNDAPISANDQRFMCCHAGASPDLNSKRQLKQNPEPATSITPITTPTATARI